MSENEKPVAGATADRLEIQQQRSESKSSDAKSKATHFGDLGDTDDDADEFEAWPGPDKYNSGKPEPTQPSVPSPSVAPQITEPRQPAPTPAARKIADEIVAAAMIAEPVITQDGIARIFAARHADRLRYCHSAGAWYEWTGTHWRRDETQRAFEFVRLLVREKSNSRETGEIKALRRTAFAAGVERFAQSDGALATTADKWDQNPFLLGTPGGTVDLLTGELRQADAGAGITKLTAVAPTERAACPIWLRFLDTATGGDQDLIRFLQLWCGYSLTGDVREHALVFLYGPGGNGKSTFVETIMSIAGDYAATASMDTFTAAVGDRHPTDLAMLRGARLVSANETEEGRAWAESRIKQQTGGDRIAARFMRRDFFTYKPEFKLTITGNHQPALANVDDAMRRRVNIVPFINQPPEIDPQLGDKLRAEGPAILRWMIDGCVEWQRSGLHRPESVVRATDDYFSEQDLLGQWLAACCDVQPGNDLMRTTTSVLYESWQNFAKRAGQKPDTMKAFSAKLEKKRLTKYRNTQGRGFLGIVLRSPSMTDDGL